MAVVQLPAGLVGNPGVIIASSLLILFFFMPWIEVKFLNINILSYSGWSLPKIASDAQHFMEEGSRGSSSPYQPLIINPYFLYFIPVLSGFLLYLAFSNKKKYFVYAEIPIIGIIGYISYEFFISSGVGQEAFGIGLIGTCLAGVFLLFDWIRNFTTVKVNVQEQIVNSEHSLSDAENSKPQGVFYRFVMLLMFVLFVLLFVFALYDILRNG